MAQSTVQLCQDMLDAIAFTGAWTHRPDNSSIPIMGAVKTGPDRWIYSQEAGPLCKLDRTWSQLLNDQANAVYTFIAEAPTVLSRASSLITSLQTTVNTSLERIADRVQQLQDGLTALANADVKVAGADQYARQISGEITRLKQDLAKLMSS